MNPITDIDDPRYVKALAHPLRIRILAILAETAASPVLLAAKLDATLGTVAYHVRTLHNLGLVELVDTRQRRGATEHYYRAHALPRFPDSAWGGLAPVAKQRMLNALLQQIGQHVTDSAASGGFDRPEAHMSHRTVPLDARGWEQLAKATRAWLDEADRIAEAAGRRLAAQKEADRAPPAVHVGLVVMLFEGRAADARPDPSNGDGDGARDAVARRRAGVRA